MNADSNPQGVKIACQFTAGAAASAVPAAGSRPKSTPSSTRKACRSNIKLTEGQAHDGVSADDMLGLLGDGCMLLADRGYDSNALREKIASQGGYAGFGFNESVA